MKTLEELYQELAAEFQSRTGLSAAGSGDLAARFYAVAAQLYGLYAQADWTRRQCFPQTAQGEELDKHGWMRGVTRREAVAAQGKVCFYADPERQVGTDIPAGTVCMTAGGVRFVTVEAASIPAGSGEAEVAVCAVEAGSGGNAAAGTVLFLAVAPTGVVACTNPEPITGGLDREEDESLRRRVLDSYRRLANGANSAFYRQEALAYEGVGAVTVLPRNRGVGTVDLVVTSRTGMPEQELLDGLQAHLNEVREIAVDVQVLAPTPRTVDVSVTLTAAAGADGPALCVAAEQAVRGWFTGERLGSGVLRGRLTALLFGLEGVENCTVLLPDSDLEGESTTLPVLGTLTVTEG